ncbi:MAG: AraC family two component transcriptional regulator [uncultured bacterium]|nr:MAG: AraC family two component transcriptional regulator [uncultured bacterium]
MSYKILLVDDDAGFMDEFSEVLYEYETIKAFNGDQALNILKKPNEIDLVILDFKMPGQNGNEVLKKIKNSDPKLPVIMLTGYSTKDVAIEALKNRADYYIEKPNLIPQVKDIIPILLNKKDGVDYTHQSSLNNKIERVMTFAMRNGNKKITLNDAAKLVFLSPKYLSRIFKQKTGSGFNEYSLKIRMNKAKDLLDNTEFTIDQIAHDIGYENVESFIRMFKKINGITTTEYRNALKTEISPGKSKL